MKKTLATMLLWFCCSTAWSFDGFAVSDIEVEGLQRISLGTVFNYMPVRVGETVDQETAEQIIQERSRLSDTAREPMFYSILGDTIEVMPTPDATYELEISYYQDIPAMSADSDTNWLLTKAPSAYLYGALIESAPYLAEDQRGLVWHELYTKCIEELMLEDEKSRFSGSTPIARHRSL